MAEWRGMGIKWSEEESRLIRKLIRQNKKWQDCAHLFQHRTRAAIRHKFDWEGRGNYMPQSHKGAYTEIPPEILDDRDRRANAPRTLTMQLMGDPCFSQSALARLEGKDIRGRAENATTGGFDHSGSDGPHAMGHDRRDAEVSISR